MAAQGWRPQALAAFNPQQPSEPPLGPSQQEASGPRASSQASGRPCQMGWPMALEPQAWGQACSRGGRQTAPLQGLQDPVLGRQAQVGALHQAGQFRYALEGFLHLAASQRLQGRPSSPSGQGCPCSHHPAALAQGTSRGSQEDLGVRTLLPRLPAAARCLQVQAASHAQATLQQALAWPLFPGQATPAGWQATMQPQSSSWSSLRSSLWGRRRPGSPRTQGWTQAYSRGRWGMQGSRRWLPGAAIFLRTLTRDSCVSPAMPCQHSSQSEHGISFPWELSSTLWQIPKMCLSSIWGLPAL